jgi:hypothetical protein
MKPFLAFLPYLPSYDAPSDMDAFLVGQLSGLGPTVASVDVGTVTSIRTVLACECVGPCQ